MAVSLPDERPKIEKRSFHLLEDKVLREHREV